MAVVERENARIHYTCSGGGPPVVLVQGVGVPASGWLPQLDGLPGFRTVALDNRGIGRSSFDGGLSIEDMAADVIAVADAEGLERFHLVGHSMGGLIAQHVALAAKARVRSLALLCTFLRGRQGTTLAPWLWPAAVRARLGTRRMRRRAFVELVMPRDFLASQDRDALCERLGALFGRDLADQPPIIMRQLGAMGRFDASARLHALADLPTLVLSAQYDGIARPAYGRALAATIPGARYVEIRGAAHAAPIQCADEVNRHLLALFRRGDDDR